MAKETVEQEVLRDLASSVKALAESAPKSKSASLAAYLEKNKRNVKLKAPFHQNGVMVRFDQLTDEQVTLINQLKPGRYNHRKWEIIRRRDRSLDFRYPNKTIEQRMNNQSLARDLTGMLQLILTEAEEQKAKRKAGIFEEDEEGY